MSTSDEPTADATQTFNKMGKDELRPSLEERADEDSSELDEWAERSDDDDDQILGVLLVEDMI